MAANSMRTTALAVVLGTVLSGALLRAANQTACEISPNRAATAEEPSHIRPADNAIRAAIDLGIESSVTFRQIVRAIEDSDSLVYINHGNCGHGRQGCLMMVTTAAHCRVMWVNIDLHRARSQSDIVGATGHELRHVMEVISEPAVRSTEAMFFLYRQIGFHATGGGFETMPAIAAGTAVRREVHGFEQKSRPGR